jgi:hypothetical protein
MSASTALQDAVIAALRADPGVTAIVGQRSYDVPPADPVYPFISLGPADMLTGRQDGYRSWVETFQVDCWTEDQRRRQPVKALRDAVIDALDQADLDLQSYGLSSLDLVLSRVMDDPDGITKHAVLQFTAQVTGPVTI